LEAAAVGVSADDFHVDSEAGSVFYCGILNPVSTQALVMVGWVFLTSLSSCIPTAFSERLAAVTVTASRSPNASVTAPSFPAEDLLGGVRPLAAQGYVGGGLDALGVDHGGGRLRLATGLTAGQSAAGSGSRQGVQEAR
jgi:hypothetical protein